MMNEQKPSFHDAVLVLNSGSSSVKFKIFGFNGENNAGMQLHFGSVIGLDDQAFFKVDDGVSERIEGGFNHEKGISRILSWVEDRHHFTLTAAGHRVVHGGDQYVMPERVTQKVVDDLKALIPLAPMHQPYNLAGIKAIAQLKPHLDQVSCFDTAFHRTVVDPYKVFALPQRFSDAGVRRYGFHGLSYEWIATQLKIHHLKLYRGRVVVAHLGNGSSLCALQEGKSLATTMGLTALDGVPMGSRVGQIDAGVVFHLVKSGFSLKEVEHILWHESGLKGLSGVSNDMRILRRAESENPRAKFAIDYFVTHTAAQIAAMSSVLGGLDGLVFTAGIGENDTRTREEIVRRLSFLQPFETLVIATDEERMIAEHTKKVLVP